MLVRALSGNGGGGGASKTVEITQSMSASGGTVNLTATGIHEIYAIYGLDTDTSSNKSSTFAISNSDGTYQYISNSPTYFNISNISGNTFVYTKGAWGVASTVVFKVVGA